MTIELTPNNTEILEEKDEESEKQFCEGEKVEYDELLSSAGEFGRYQLLLLLSMCPFYMFGVYVQYTQMFITEVSQNHWCWIPELENLTEIERRDLAIPNDDSIFGYSRCTAYVANWNEVLETGLIPDETWETEPCQHGWEFDKTEIPYPTISSELGWVCDRDSYQATAQSLFSVGSIFGGLIFGWVGDRYGRIPAAVGANLIACIGGISSCFAKNFVQFTICRIITGVAYDNCIVMIYLLIIEYVAPKYRSLMANATFAIFHTLFVTTLPFLALALGHWKLISLVTSLPLALAIFTPLIIPESPRWLLSKGRIDETIQKVLTIGRVNKKIVPPKLIEQFKSTALNSPKENNHSILVLFKNSTLRNMFTIVCLEYMCCILVFDGILRSIGQLDADFFISFAVISFTELPSMLLVAFVLDFFGRRWLTTVVMSISCIFSFLTAFVGTGVKSVIFAIVARFAVNMSFAAITQWSAEVLPTGVRGTGVSFVHICGFVATAISPFIVYLNVIVYWLPLTVIGSIAGFGAIIALFLPETAKKELPHTFEEAEDLVKSQKFCDMPCVKKHDKDSDLGDTEEYVNQGFTM